MLASCGTTNEYFVEMKIEKKPKKLIKLKGALWRVGAMSHYWTWRKKKAKKQKKETIHGEKKQITTVSLSLSDGFARERICSSSLFHFDLFLSLLLLFQIPCQCLWHYLLNKHRLIYDGTSLSFFLIPCMQNVMKIWWVHCHELGFSLYILFLTKSFGLDLFVPLSSWNRFLTEHVVSKMTWEGIGYASLATSINTIIYSLKNSFLLVLEEKKEDNMYFFGSIIIYAFKRMLIIIFAITSISLFHS